MIQVTTHLAMIVEPTNHITLNTSVDNLLKAIEYADEAEGVSDVIALVSLNRVLLQLLRVNQAGRCASFKMAKDHAASGSCR